MKFIKPEDLPTALRNFSSNLRVTEGDFSITVDGLLEDMEWNHMDQLHRPYIHNTYEEAVRVAVSKEFAFSLTRMGRLPIFMAVTDIRIKPGLYYQCMTILGLIYVHLMISMEEVASEKIKLNVTWYITSHKWFKLLHKPLSRKFFKLNTRLQIEDHQIRAQRFSLRKKGYKFHSTPVDYLNSNTIRRNTVYPDLPVDSVIAAGDLPLNKITEYHLGEVDFLIKRIAKNNYFLWPAACPHEGGALKKGTECDNHQIQCPWHGLKFTAVKLSNESQEAQGFGFSFKLLDNNIAVQKL